MRALCLKFKDEPLHKIKVLLLTVLFGFILGFIIFHNYYGIHGDLLIVVTQKALLFALILGAIPLSWYILAFLFWLFFGGIEDDHEGSSNSSGLTSSNYDGGYTSGGSSDGGGGGCD